MAFDSCLFFLCVLPFILIHGSWFQPEFLQPAVLTAQPPLSSLAAGVGCKRSRFPWEAKNVWLGFDDVWCKRKKVLASWTQEIGEDRCDVAQEYPGSICIWMLKISWKDPNGLSTSSFKTVLFPQSLQSYKYNTKGGSISVSGIWPEPAKTSSHDSWPFCLVEVGQNMSKPTKPLALLGNLHFVVCLKGYQRAESPTGKAPRHLPSGHLQWR